MKRFTWLIIFFLGATTILGQHYIALANHGGNVHYGKLYTISVNTDGSSIAAVDNWQFAAALGGTTENVNMCRIGSTDYYLIVWADGDGDGQMATVEISGVGDIDDGGATDTFEFEKDNAGNPRVRQVGTGGYYLVTYNINSVATWAKTYAISDVGVITAPSGVAADSLEIATIDVRTETMAIGGDRYFCSGWGTGTDGFCATFYVNPADGQISNAPEDAWEFHPWNWYSQGRGCRINNDKHFFITGYGATKNWYSWEVDTTDGLMNHTPISSGINNNVWNWKVVKPLSVADSVYATPYQEVTSLDGYLRTFVIKTDGTVPNFHVCLDSVEFEPTKGEHFDLLETSTSGLVLVTSMGTADGDGYIRSFTITGNGTITGPVATLEFNTNYSGGQSMVEISLVSGWSGKSNGVSSVANINGVTAIANRNGV